LDFPVVSGNVSLYNETDGVGIPPTPVVGGIGLIEDVSKIATLKGAQEGDHLIIIGETTGHLGASAYARMILGLDGGAAGPPPSVDLEVEKSNAAFVRGLIRDGLAHAVHDVSEGGIACAAAEMALSAGKGLLLDLYPLGHGVAGAAFGENGARYLIAASPVSIREITAKAASNGIRCEVVANVTGFSEKTTDIAFNFDERGLWSVELSTLRAAHEGWLPKYMRGEV
jgi:phosphoribosylformylglycinamidine (FGAM) synthase-like enzyme